MLQLRSVASPLRPVLRQVVRYKKKKAKAPDPYLSPWLSEADPMELLHRFEEVHRVSRIANYATLGSAKRTRHGCTVHLPLPPKIQEALGVRRFIRRGEVMGKKTEALRSAVKVLFDELRDECRVAIKDGNDTLVAELAKLEPGANPDSIANYVGRRFDNSNWRELLRRFGGGKERTVDQEVKEAVLMLSMVSEAPAQFMRHKTLSKKAGPLLQVNGTVYPIGGGKMLSIAKAYELDPATGEHTSYEELERTALLHLGSTNALKQSQTQLYKSFTRLRHLASERAAHPAYPGAAMLLLDSNQLASLAPSAAGALSALVALDESSSARQHTASPRLNGSSSNALPSPELVDFSELMRRKPCVASRLPIHALREALITRLAAAQLCLIEGGTGSGKTTQVPQFLLDDALTHGRFGTRIVVAQPRRLAAVSIAHRVASERGERVGASVGYAVHLQRRAPRPHATIELVTAGTLLRRIVHDPLLSSTSCVIVDEAHERDAQTDLLLAAVRRLLLQRTDLKAVVMSATLETSALRQWFGALAEGAGAHLSVPAATNHPVEERFLEDLSNMGLAAKGIVERVSKLEASVRSGRSVRSAEGAATDVDHASLPDSESALTVNVCELAAEVISHITRGSRGSRGTGKGGDDALGCVLCFLPGWEEISLVRRQLLQNARNGTPLDIHTMHSKISLAEQQHAMRPAADGKRKVVLATNIAQTSLTFDDATVVVDAGRARLMRFHPATRVSALETESISKADAKQRLGRVGRVAPGTCYRLYSREHADAMPDFVEPEVRRANLESLLLQAKTLIPRVHSAHVLADLMDPPSEQSVRATRERLHSLGALREETGATDAVHSGGNDALEGGDASSAFPSAVSGGPVDRLTALGEALGRLPLDPAVGRMLLLGAALGCADHAVRLAAVLSAPRGVTALADKRGRGYDSIGGDESQTSLPSDVLRAVGVYEAMVARDADPALLPPDVKHVVALEADITRTLHQIFNSGNGGPAGLGDANRNAESEPLRNALVCAAMPGVAFSHAQMMSRRHYITRTYPSVRVHGSSCNAALLARSGDGVWLVFQTMLDVLSSKEAGVVPKLLVTSQVSPLQLALFGGEDLHVEAPLRAALLDRWVIARPHSLGKQGLDALAALRDARSAMAHALEASLAQPRRPLPAEAASFITDLAAALARDTPPPRELDRERGEVHEKNLRALRDHTVARAITIKAERPNRPREMAYEVVFTDDDDDVSYASKAEDARPLSGKERATAAGDRSWQDTPKRKRKSLVRDVGAWVPDKARRPTGNRFG